MLQKRAHAKTVLSRTICNVNQHSSSLVHAIFFWKSSTFLKKCKIALLLWGTIVVQCGWSYTGTASAWKPAVTFHQLASGVSILWCREPGAAVGRCWIGYLLESELSRFLPSSQSQTAGVSLLPAAPAAAETFFCERWLHFASNPEQEMTHNSDITGLKQSFLQVWVRCSHRDTGASSSTCG